MKNSIEGKKILLGVTGSIAAYKACELVRLLVKAGADVQVVMTRHACEFVTPLTFRTLSKHPVGVDMFDSPREWSPEHISLAEWADVLLIAPCTANVLAKLAQGLADDLLTSTCLASRAPLFVAPAMNTLMWEHPATVANVRTLEERGVSFIDAGSGELACGTVGKGRLAEPAEIVRALESHGI